LTFVDSRIQDRNTFASDLSPLDPKLPLTEQSVKNAFGELATRDAADSIDRAWDLSNDDIASLLLIHANK